jgi:hypothetical protein
MTLKPFSKNLLNQLSKISVALGIGAFRVCSADPKNFSQNYSNILTFYIIKITFYYYLNFKKNHYKIFHFFI